MTAPFITDPAAEFALLSGDDWGPFLVKALRRAQASVILSIYLISPHWKVPNRFKLDLLGELCECARRGLICRGILAGPSQIETRQVYNRQAAKQMIEAGWKIRFTSGPRLLHEKILLLDRDTLLIGSHNLSKASLTSNLDTSIAIRSTPLADLIHRQFWQRWRVAKPWEPDRGDRE